MTIAWSAFLIKKHKIPCTGKAQKCGHCLGPTMSAQSIDIEHLKPVCEEKPVRRNMFGCGSARAERYRPECGIENKQLFVIGIRNNVCNPCFVLQFHFGLSCVKTGD